jgi:hypothetical protein
LPVPGSFGWKLTSSQQSGDKHANPNIIPYLAVALFVKIYVFFSTDCSSNVHNLNEQQTVVYSICRGQPIRTHVHANIHAFTSVIVEALIYLNLYCEGGTLLLIQKQDFIITVIFNLFSFYSVVQHRLVEVAAGVLRVSKGLQFSGYM